MNMYVEWVNNVIESPDNGQSLSAFFVAIGSELRGNYSVNVILWRYARHGHAGMEFMQGEAN